MRKAIRVSITFITGISMYNTTTSGLCASILAMAIWPFASTPACFFFSAPATTEISTRPYTLSLHDALPISVPVLVTLDPTLPGRVEVELARQLGDLPTAETARAALTNGGVVVVASLDDGIAA